MERWFQAIGEGVAHSLDELLDRALAEGGPLAPDVGRLVSAWKLLLRLHGRTGRGGCRECGRAQGRRLCAVWQVAVGYFLRRLPEAERSRRG
ncbi:hypothetical protein [Prauserella cavernicola]|uniref:Uncharacterized protein n=1 Tax=Prauserella cavernicola TaxID=2800127 RepID=A0A934V5E0_9PSEU|nr:hypothetical protein [Prauserella cavernicola]MBK1789371.1 hypothetical protein [Prauserella cavernicola]